MKIEGTLIEMGDLDGLGQPGLRIESGAQVIDICGLTREQIKAMPAALFKPVVISVEVQA